MSLCVETRIAENIIIYILLFGRSQLVIIITLWYNKFLDIYIIYVHIVFNFSCLFYVLCF